MKLLLILLLISNFSFAKTTPYYAKEVRWAAQVEGALMDGEVVWLSVNGHKFMSLYTASETKTKKTAVVIHGLGVHPDWGQVVQPLRVALAERGINTLSVQMPVLANDADVHQYLPLLNDADQRIRSAVNYIKSQNLNSDYLIAHSLGGVMSAHYLNNKPQPFKKFVAIGMPDLAVKYLSKINIPVLDLYGTEDIKPVLNSVKERAKAFSNNKNYTQKKVDADHFFNDKNELLIREVSTWLK
ncbi:hypothetical protein MNB_SUP05-SYMBIONT-5-355 [hydrothermal vent metagenome]|uniref:Serine aminopeptidase S33 domain-containing protein n=1 Tax=hydrothermal vent metagenome TaxID=652676 RepID=A0A1W1E5J4_9ZZZZ